MPKRDTSEVLEEIAGQNELILSLLGRIAFKNDDLKSMVMKGSKKPTQIIRAYNMCDGKTPITKIAKKVGIAQPSLTVAIEKWEGLGIVFRRKKGAEVLPLKLFEIQ